MAAILGTSCDVQRGECRRRRRRGPRAVRFAQVEQEVAGQDRGHSVIFADDLVRGGVRRKRGGTTYGLLAIVAMLPKETPTGEAIWDEAVMRTKGRDGMCA